MHLNRLEEWEEVGLGGLRPVLQRAALAAAQAAKLPLGELSITCLPAGEMARLNRRWLGREGLTDVIAFRLGEGEAGLADVYVCPEMALRAARSGEARSARRELIRLVVHGVLHAGGHDHPEGEDRWASEMFRLQERLVDRMEEPGEGEGEG